ncbi:MAG: hypothetical protein IKY82_00140 [Alistipes sp.]|nr:hypothetical protein [Alistipes sp.]
MKRFFAMMVAVAALAASLTASAQTPMMHIYPKTIKSGPFNTGHIQGIAVDTEKGYVYYSYTTILIKTDLQGNIIGSVTGLLGHLGDLDFNAKDGRVYGSLEYKNDAIGRGIVGGKMELQNAFYIAIFDVDRITRQGMSAERDGIMTTVFLPTVLNDYLATVECENGKWEHRLGCSGIDGVAFGPKFGKEGGKQMLTVAYGVYGDRKRTDNDYQVLLQYDVTKWKKYERTLSQHNMHSEGPAKPNAQYFAYTGNTTYGVQNLEYDDDLKVWWMAVYNGNKPEFPNYSLYAVDGTAKPTKQPLKGVPYIKEGNVVELWPYGLEHEATGIRGWMFGVGSTGIAYLGNGLYYFSHNHKTQDGLQGSNIRLHYFGGKDATQPFQQLK